MSANRSRLPPDEPVPELFGSIRENCLPFIDSVSVPILGIHNEGIVHDRSGVLYQIGGHHFVLTAAHDIRAIMESNIPLYLAMNRQGVEPIPIVGSRFLFTEVEGRDVAAIWLPPETAQEVSRHKRFLFHNQINQTLARRGTPFVFFGYPMVWSARVLAPGHVHSRALAFLTVEYQGERSPLARYQPDVHVLLQFTQDALDLGQDASVSLPHVGGISGCGIWQVGDLDEVGLRPRSAETITLVGIQHEWSRQYGYVQATRIGFALRLIMEFYPETEAAMNVAYPSGY